MNGVEGSTNAAGMVRAVPKPTHGPPPPAADEDELEPPPAEDTAVGPLGAAQQTIRPVLAGLGFVDPKASQQEIIQMQLQYMSAVATSGELTSEAAAEMTTLSTSQIVERPEQAMRTQARVGHKPAQRLLA